MKQFWDADPSASFARRLGRPARELDAPPTDGRTGCPAIWALDNGDVAVVGRDLTASYTARLPDEVSIRHDERLVIIPGALMISAKEDIPDA
ncbi:hypothetical protein [Amycolatopsis cihanbeyliensis]|uniref:Uncharacterized protein n=1 Tax=Amycolatopsis cihanbeyliensis TaxID=1128664 RepID=A0A542DS95_AMYCI|nr:hypothetical protein [Amycolatopsis cihanbeyliensis]TQJ05865.1 hypothetical protein FB471_5709 [Amycolatopsis cihanbeyliensis]